MTTLQNRPTAESALIEQIETLAPAPAWSPEYDLTTNGREVRLSVDLPGVLRGNLHVDVEGNRLHVSGYRVPAYVARALDHASTRRTGGFALDVAIPAWVDPTRATQTFGEGILTVVLPRRRASQPSAHGPL